MWSPSQLQFDFFVRVIPCLVYFNSSSKVTWYSCNPRKRGFVWINNWFCHFMLNGKLYIVNVVSNKDLKSEEWSTTAVQYAFHIYFTIKTLQTTFNLRCELPWTCNYFDILCDCSCQARDKKYTCWFHIHHINTTIWKTSIKPPASPLPSMIA